MVNIRIVLVMAIAMAATLMLTACGKPADPPKTAEQQKAEKDAAVKTSRENPVYGDQLKALDKAKAVAEDAKKREEAVGTADDKLKSGY